MEKYNEFAGVYTLLLTPFNLDRSIDYRGYEEYVDWQSSFKPQHLFAVCGSSEMSALTPEERVKCAGLAVRNSNGVPVFATANLAESFDDQVEEMKRMEAQGVSGHVFVTKGMCDRHGELVKTGKFKGIKDTTCTMPLIESKIAVQGDSNVLQANIPLLYDSWLKGARGVVATPTSCGAGLFVKMWDEFVKGDLEAARRTHQHIILLDNAIDADFNASAKYLVKLQGVNINWYTRGSHNLSDARMRSIEVFHDWAVSEGLLK